MLAVSPECLLSDTNFIYLYCKELKVLKELKDLKNLYGDLKDLNEIF